MDEKHDAFDQSGADTELLPCITDIQGDGDENKQWRIDWDDGTSRETGMAWVVLCARDDENATVTEL